MTSANKMPYVRLGKSGLKVSKIILGCMSYGDPTIESWYLDEKTGIEHIKYAYEQGINTFDVANTYSAGTSEEILGKAIKAIGCPRESVVILTKVYFAVSREKNADMNDMKYINQHGLSRKHIFDSVKASLKRLDMEYIDVLQCHRFDYNTPIEETMQALHDVVQAGLVRYVGMSSCYAYQFQAMQNYAINNHLTPFISMQNYHNAAYREEEREMVPTLKMFGVGMIPWSPLSRGFLARPWNAGDTARTKTDVQWKARGHDKPSEALIKINETVQEIAKKKGCTMAQVAIAWSMSKDFLTAPIIGSTSLKNLDELLAAIHISLDEEDVKKIDELYEPRAIIGHT